MSGVPINREVSKIVSRYCSVSHDLLPIHNYVYVYVCMIMQIIELLKMTVPPAIILQMLKTLRSDYWN